MARWLPLALATLVALALPAPVRADAPLDATVSARVDAGRTGFLGGAGLGRPPLEEAWRVPVGSGEAVLAADGLVFAASQPADRRTAVVSAYDVEGGTVRWTRTVSAEAALAYGDGLLVVRTRKGDLLALDGSTGAVAWGMRLEERPWMDRSPIVADGTVYVDDWAPDGTLLAIDLHTGRDRWRSRFAYNAEPAVAGGQVLEARTCVGDAFDAATGERRWNREDECSADYDETRPASDGGRLVTPTGGILDAASGAVEDLIGLDDAASLVGDALVGRVGTSLFAMSVTGGVVRWSATSVGTYTGPPLVVDGVVYEGTMAGTVEARDLDTGVLLWTGAAGRGTGDRSVRTLAAGDGHLLAVAGGELVAFAAGATSPAAGLRVLTGPSGPTRSGTASVTFAVTPGLTQRCALDGDAATPCAGSATYAGLGDGPHTVTVRALDADGVTRGITARGFTVDRTGPRAFIDGFGPDSTTRSERLTVSTVTEEHNPGECRVDAGAWVPCAPATFDGLAEGPHDLQVRGRDALGNVGPVLHRAFAVDTTAPTIEVDAAPPARTRDPDALVAWRVGADTTDLECDVDGRHRYEGCTSPMRFTGLAEGYHEVALRAYDHAGNDRAVRIGWEVDRTPPTTRITTGPPSRTDEPSPAFEVADDPDPFVRRECRVDAGAWVTCRPHDRWAPDPLPDGDHVVMVRGTDEAGNVESDPPSWSFTVDTRAPETEIAAGPPARTDARRVTFLLRADETRVVYECALDGAPWSTCERDAGFTVLESGAHRLDVRATDDLGHVDLSPATWRWERVPPDEAEVRGTSAQGPAGVPAGAVSTPQPSPTAASPAIDPGTGSSPGTPRALAGAIARRLARSDGGTLARGGLAVRFDAAAGALRVRLLTGRHVLAAWRGRASGATPVTARLRVARGDRSRLRRARRVVVEVRHVSEEGVTTIARRAVRLR